MGIAEPEAQPNAPVTIEAAEDPALALLRVASSISGESLISQYHPHVISILRQMNVPASEESDVAQDIWLALVEENFRRLRTWDPTRSRFRTYLTTLVANLVRDYFRSRRYRYVERKVPLEPFFSEYDDEASVVLEQLLAAMPEPREQERVRRLHDAVVECLGDLHGRGQIGDQEHLALLLRLEGCTAGEIAAKLALTVTQVESLLKRGRAECAAHLRRQGVHSDKDLV